MARILSRSIVVGASLASIGLLAGAGSGGCSNYGGATLADSGLGTVPGTGTSSGATGGTDATVPAGQGVGQPCSMAMACRPGLTCGASNTCEPCGCTAAGMECTISDECAANEYCGPMRTCTAAGAGTSGAACSSDASCASGLRCNLVGLNAECEPEGKGDVGASCTTGADCFAGLGCAGGLCSPFPPGATVPIAIPTPWTGEVCMDDAGPTTAYFHVPRGMNDGDFYRLPFPNDVRSTGGKISLTGHPTPGSGLLGYDLVQRWITDLQNTVDGFSTYPTVFFRFSAPVDIGGTLKAKNALQFLDLTDPTTPVQLGYSWVATTARNMYICNNWMAVRPQQGQPLTPGHTYAVVIASTVLDSMSKPISVSPDLTALLGATMPSDTELMGQWSKYAPLRGWLSSQGMQASSILNATVFTVGHPTAIGPSITTAVAAADAPTATGWIRCGDAPSPCPQATGDRACPATPDPSFDELHALVTLPIFQQGTEPYSNPPDGDFVLDATGTPTLQRTEQVCMALTVPKGTMPAAGWPLVLYAHGTGGSFRSHVSEGVAGRLASVDDGMGGNVQIAVLGIDQVETGTRRGTSTDSPDNLFYNFANPGAARGNPLQGAADQISLLRFVSGFDLPAATSPSGAEIKFGHVAFWGHSQGATEGGIAMPYATGVLGAVLSGEGASLMDALVTKTNPVDIAAALPVALEDPNVDVNHPVLALLQNDLGLVDPLNHAAALVSNPIAAANQKHVFQPFGQMDSYAPPVTEQTFAIAAGLTEAAPPTGVTDNPSWVSMPAMVPAGGNVTVKGVTLTAIVRQYAPAIGSDGGVVYDGHFVSYDNPQAESDVNHFLADALAGKAPMVGR